MTDRRGVRGRLQSAGALVASVTIAGLAMISCGGGGSSSSADQPIFPGGCPPANATGNGVSRVHLKVVEEGTTAIALAPVCVAGQGPYPFVVDSGAGSTVFDSQLVKVLHLTATGPSQTVGAVNCNATQTPVAGPSWSVGGVPLAPQTMSSINIPGFGLRSAPAGLLGSDVLSRFGAIQLDYRHQTLALPGPEGPAPPPGDNVHGPSAVAVPPGVSLAPPTSSVPLIVAQGQGETAAVVPMRIGDHGPYSFILDTGSSQSSVDPQVVKTVGLPHTGKHKKAAGVGCTQDVQQVQSGPWSAGTLPLRPQPLLEAVPLPGASEINGLLGSDVLHSFGAIVIGYAAGTLLVSAR